MQEGSPNTDSLSDSTNVPGRRRRAPRDYWMVPINPVLLVTNSGPKEVLPSEITAKLIGWKAFGLTCLLREWTPSFFVVAASTLNDAYTEPLLGEWIGQAVKDKQIRADQNVIVRSSGTAETMKHRGRLHSEVCKVTEVLHTIRALLARTKGRVEGEIHWIVQDAALAVAKGHLSNERHVSREGRDWLSQIEYTDDRGDSATRIAVRTWRDGMISKQRELRCTSETELTLCLKRIALWASQFSARTHFEWVWDRKAVRIVQSDREESSDGTKPRDLLPQQIPQIQISSLRLFRLAENHDFQAYRKLANVRLYAGLGYGMPEFFVLDDPEIIAGLFNGIVGPDLEHDLTELTKRPLVIRTDGANIPAEKYEMLPRTEDIRSSDTAKIWLTSEFVRTIRESKLDDFSLCLIAHHFIPSVAAAWARAEPNSRMVRIESLWGLPEGLYWFAHDTFEVDTGTMQIEPDRSKAIRRYKLAEHLRFKSTFIASDATGRWIPHQTQRPYDWGRSVTRRAWLFEIAHTTRLIAGQQQHPVVVMWFIDNHPQATAHKVLPWFHLKSELSGSPNPAPRNKRRGATNFKITTTESWQELQQKIAEGTRIERVIVEPRDPELIRNRSFTETLAQLAAEKHFVVVLSGGILSHAYYVLQREGARLECVDLFGANEEVIEFNKLVRDLVPTLIRQGGERVSTVVLRGEALITALRRKLVEEAYEALDAPSGGELISELADILEVIRGLTHHLHLAADDLRIERAEKLKKRGGFRDGLMLRTTATQHSLQTTEQSELLPGLETDDNDSFRATITNVADLPKTRFYRRPDLRQVNQTTIEKMLTFETSLAELPPLNPASLTFVFSLPIDEGRERELVVTLELQRDRSNIRGVIRLRPSGQASTAIPEAGAQLFLDLK